MSLCDFITTWADTSLNSTKLINNKKKRERGVLAAKQRFL
jgi:hypothetical protein